MGVELNASDVLAIAVELERRGRRFYQLAAAQAEDSVSRKLFEELSSMEDQHEQVFEGLGVRLGMPHPSEIDDASVQWDLVAKTFLGGLERDLFGRFEGTVGPVEILREALAFEKDTIVLLLALKNMLSSESERAGVDHLIREELGHVILLGSRMAQSDRTPMRRATLFGGTVAPSA